MPDSAQPNSMHTTPTPLSLEMAADLQDHLGEAVVAPAPLRPNPVTQSEMHAGSIELF